MSTKKSTSPLATKILADLAYRGKALSELVGSPMERKYRLDARKPRPDKCRVCGGILVSGIEEFEPGLPSTFFALWTSNGAFCVRDDESGLKDVGYDCNYLYWKRRATNEIERSPFDES